MEPLRFGDLVNVESRAFDWMQRHGFFDVFQLTLPVGDVILALVTLGGFYSFRCVGFSSGYPQKLCVYQEP